MKNILALGLLASFLISCDKTKNDVNDEATKTNTLEANTSEVVEKTKIVIATGKVEPEMGIVNFSAPVGGIVKNVLKKEGEEVLKNDIILQLIDEVEQNKVNEIRSQIQTQQSQIQIEQTQISEAQINLNNQNSLLSKAKRLVTSGAETQQAVDDINNEIKIYNVNIKRAKAKVDYAKSRIGELMAQLQSAETEVQKRVFKAPFDGKILSISLEKGEAITQFAEYAEFAPSGNLVIKAQVDELFSPELKIGQQVDVFYRGSDKVIATGEVVTVSPYLKKKSIFSEKTDDQEDRRVREIKISLKNANNLIINSKVDCKIKI